VEAFFRTDQMAETRELEMHAGDQDTQLLFKRREIDYLIGAVERKGFTLVPLQLYWKTGKAKLEIGLAKGKKQHDKRATEKDRDWERDRARAMRRG
jgi:SsrA-binding protein